MGEGGRVRLVDEFAAKKGGTTSRVVDSRTSRTRRESQGSDTATMNFVTDDRLGVSSICFNHLISSNSSLLIDLSTSYYFSTLSGRFVCNIISP
ncbi:unnamed protein product [Strongylus vulgaris]|uniref:Uncharacterized protein n=1 Tax=Strongylus vulgaris TaxID=40348 RepID=A0A3P7J6I7_STRVU|nr:unnamed protein product [Strongylus vulgaris]